MLDVLENAGLCINVAKGEIVSEKLKLNFTVDKKTGVKITGIIGKKGGLEKSYYEDLLREELEKEEGYKIFMFHSLLSELKPKEFEKVDSQPLSLLPKNFNYYAGGHPHFVFAKEIEGYGLIAYPGPLFPNNFAELEKLERGGFYIFDNNKVEWMPIQIYNVYMKNTNALTTKEFEEIKIDTASTEDTEERLIKEHLGKIKVDGMDLEKEERLVKELIKLLDKEKEEGEKVADFERRIKGDINRIVEIK